MEGIQVSVEKTGTKNDIAVIKVGGYIDTTTSAELEHSLDQLLKANCYNIVIDLGNVDYISSAGWGIFISEIKGIREKGGDLKLVKMIPDVYEVFELLEFHYILKAFDTLEEAIADFHRGAMPVKSRSPENLGTSQGESAKAAEVETDVLEKDRSEEVSAFARAEKQEGSVQDKIRQIVLENPEVGSIKIMKELNTPRYGNIKLNWFQIRRLLKQMGLDSRKRRVEFFKKQSFG
jgi:anti-sigma B factor antagonist